jgi:hypothetical protein
MFREPRLAQKRLRFLIFNMLLTASNTLFKLGVRPRAVTTPVRVHNHSGTCGETSTREDLRPILRPSPTQTARKVHYFFTVRLRECVSFLIISTSRKRTILIRSSRDSPRIVRLLSASYEHGGDCCCKCTGATFYNGRNMETSGTERIRASHPELGGGAGSLRLIRRDKK